MVKKRIVKKRIAKKQAKHATNNKPKPQNKLQEVKDKIISAAGGQMSKLEYEQSLMDPRFRAAMMGFNNPALNMNHQLNKELHERETKNNQLSREIIYQTEMANAKKLNQTLKDELNQNKQQHQSELNKLRVESEIKIKEFEKQALEQKHEYDLKVQQLNNDVNEQKRKNQDQQDRYRQSEENLKLANELEIQKIKAHHEEQIKPLNEQINNLKQQSKLNKTKYESEQKIADAVTAKLVAEFKASTKATVTELNQKTEAINSKMRDIDMKINAIKEIKNAKFELDKAQIDAINQPILQELESQSEQLKQQYTLNKKQYDEISKQNEIKNKIEQLEQKLDPVKRDEYNDKLKQEKLETHQLELINTKAQTVNNAYMENEDIRSKIITNAARIFPDFNVEDIEKPNFKDRLNIRETELRKQYAELVKQHEQTQRNLEYQKKLEALKIQQEEATARLSVSEAPSPEYLNGINEAVKRKTQIENEIGRLNKLYEDIGEILNTNEANLEDIYHIKEVFLNTHPNIKARAEKYAMQAHKTPDLTIEEFGTFIKNEKDKVEHFTDIIRNLPDFMDKGLNQDIDNLQNKLKEAGIDTTQDRYQLNKQLEMQLEDNKQLRLDKEDLQRRYKQLSGFGLVADNAYGENRPITTEEIESYLTNYHVNDFEKLVTEGVNLNVNLNPDA